MIGAVLLAASVGGLAASIPTMARRLSHRGLAVVWFADPVAEERFKFAGEEVEIRTVEAAGDGAGARPTLEVVWRGETSSFEIEEGVRDEPRLPGLLRHDDWLRVLVMAEGARSGEEVNAGIAAGTIRPRLIVAMRRPAEGYDPGSWGTVRRREWRYRFLELLPPSASPETATRLHEHTYAELDRLSDPAAQRDPALRDEVWKYSAMQHVTPGTLFRARNRPVEDAMQAMGWTWPVAGVSVIGAVAGLILVSSRDSGRGG
jgi:hypothetical protein